MRQKLTKSVIDGIQPAKRDAIYWDAELKGFGIKVTPTGRKVFVVQHRPKGHRGAPRKYTIGKFGEWTIQQARNRARDVLNDSAKGIDQGARQRADAVRKASDKVDLLIDEFILKHASKNRSGNETRRILYRDALPLIGSRSIHGVTKRDVIAMIERVADRGSNYMANRTLAAARKFFNWCVSRGVIDASPAAGVVAPTKELSRDRVLSRVEIRAIMKAATQMGYPFGTIAQLLFLTAQRRDEVAGMRWSEIDFDNSVWTLPGERTKNGNAHDVHLSRSASQLLANTPRFAANDAGSCDLVFTTTGTSSVSGFSKAKRQLDELSGVADWRIHDIRRTVVTEMSKISVPVHVADKILNHRSGVISGVTAVYQRNEFTDERRKAMDEWATQLSRVVDSDAPA